MSWGKRFIFALAFAGLAFTMHGVSASDACRAGRAGGTPPSVGDTYIHVYLVSECKVGAGVATTPDPGVAIGAGVTSLDADGDGIRDFTLTVALDQASDRSFAADAKITLTKTEAGPITDKLYFEARAAIAGDGERIGFDFGFDTSGYNRRGEVDTARMPRFSTSVPENIVITATTSLRLKDPVEKQPTELRVELTEDSDRHALRLFADVCAPYGTCAAEHLTTSVAMSHVPSGRTPALDSATRSAAGGSLDGVPGDADEARRNAQAHAEGTAQDVTGIASGAANGDTEKVQSDAEDGIGRQRQYSGPRPVMTLRYWKNGDGRLVRYCAGMPPVNVDATKDLCETFTALFPIPHIDGQIKFVRSASADEKALILEGDLQITDFPGDLAVDVNDLPGSNEIIVRRNPVEPPPTLTSRKLIIKESENDPEALAIHELSLIGIPTSATIVAGDDDVQVRAGTSTCEASGSEELSEAAVHVTRGKPTVTAPAIARLRPDDNVLRVSARTQLAPGSTSGRATAMDVRTTLHGVKAFCYKRPRDGSPGRFTLDALTGGTGRFTTAIDSIDVTSNSHIAGVVTIDPMPQEVHLAYDPDSRTLSGSSSAAADLKIHGLEALGTHDETSMPFVIAPRELQDDDLLQAWLRDEGRPSADDLHTWVHTGGRQDGQRINLHWELSSGRFHFRQPGFGSIPWQSSTRESWWNADVDAPGERYPVFPNEGKAVHVSLSYSGISMGPLHVVSDRRTPDGATPPNMRIDTTRERTIVEAAVVPLELDLVIDFLRNDFYKTGIINVTGTTTGDRPSVRLRMFDLLSDPSEDGCAAPRAPLPEETFDTGSVPTDVNGEVIPELELDIANIPSAFGVQINT
ncbi:MAG TPA: hypothetical protein VM600_01775, partial [Actinomycetota bacterium]|nr:hypothetical protein [Actinomycetota bacterium]